MFGNPCMGCQGVGICKVMSYGQHISEKCKCPHVTAWLSLTEEGRIRMNFLKSSMDKAFIRKHFGWLLFQIYEAYKLPENLAQKLGLSEATIRPGIYTVWETHRAFVVDF